MMDNSDTHVAPGLFCPLDLWTVAQRAVLERLVIYGKEFLQGRRGFRADRRPRGFTSVGQDVQT